MHSTKEERSSRIRFRNATILDNQQNATDTASGITRMFFQTRQLLFRKLRVSACITYACMHARMCVRRGRDSSRRREQSSKLNRCWLAIYNFAESTGSFLQFDSLELGRTRERSLNRRPPLGTLIEPFISKIEFDRCEYEFSRRIKS